VQRVLEQIEAGGEIGREALRRVFPRWTQLERDASGRYFVAVFEDGVPGLLWDFHAASLAAFMAAGVGNNVVAGARLWRCFLRLPRRRTW
jgi:hypothetical protein